MKTILNVLGLLSGVTAAVFLYFGSQETPWGIQSWKGKTPEEDSFRRRRRCTAVTGFVLLGLAFVLQLIALLLPN